VRPGWKISAGCLSLLGASLFGFQNCSAPTLTTGNTIGSTQNSAVPAGSPASGPVSSPLSAITPHTAFGPGCSITSRNSLSSQYTVSLSLKGGNLVVPVEPGSAPNIEFDLGISPALSSLNGISIYFDTCGSNTPSAMLTADATTGMYPAWGQGSYWAPNAIAVNGGNWSAQFLFTDSNVVTFGAGIPSVFSTQLVLVQTVNGTATELARSNVVAWGEAAKCPDLDPTRDTDRALGTIATLKNDEAIFQTLQAVGAQNCPTTPWAYLNFYENVNLYFPVNGNIYSTFDFADAPTTAVSWNLNAAGGQLTCTSLLPAVTNCFGTSHAGYAKMTYRLQSYSGATLCSSRKQNVILGPSSSQVSQLTNPCY